MASEEAQLGVSGASVSRQSLNKAFTAAAHADDYAFAEILKLQPYNGTAFDKAILPFGARGTNNAFVQPGGPAGPIVVLPFRFLVGSRITATGTPPAENSPLDPILTTAAELNYRDVRSAVFAVANASSLGYDEALGYAIPAAQIAANASSHARWDLIYATFYLDQPSTTQVIVKPPTTGTAGPVSATATYVTGVGSPPQAVTGAAPAITVLEGTPAALPTIPGYTAGSFSVADTPASGIFNVPLAAILIPSGYSSGGTIAGNQIALLAPIGEIAEVMGGVSSGPVSVCTGYGAALAGNSWSGRGNRPGTVIPPTMKGGAKRTFHLDATNAAGSAPVGNAHVVDNSIDWRNRDMRVECYAYPSSGAGFASDPAQSTTPYVPKAAPQTVTVATSVAQALIVQSLNLSELAVISGMHFADVAGGYDYQLPLTNLPNGATLESVSFYVTGVSDGTAAISLWRETLATGTQTQIGTTTTLTAATLSSSVFRTGAASSVIDTTQYAYYALVVSSTGGGEASLTWSAPTANITVTSTAPSTAVCRGQSFHEDSDSIVGSELGTGSGAGMAGLFTPMQLPQMGASSQLGLYVDLATGNLVLYYVGTPAVKAVMEITATGAFDNV